MRLPPRLPLSRIIRARIGTFAGGNRGSVTVEAAIMLPLLVWAYCALYTFFDAYRQTSISHKAAYTISDMISRETDPIDDAFLDGSYQMLNFLTRSPDARRLRVSVIRYDSDMDVHEVEWSHTRGTVAALDNDALTDWDTKLPVMVDEERLILVETWMDYDAPFSIVNLNGQTIETFIFTRPRFVLGQVCWDTCGGA